ncbi:CLUMA_CG016794, isoform A [Clunio marinus]|uniref:CLUMA_CG016794, isoform A n=1 Tax=Clunio marinus TaxID=568069 RepID=A0A1J1IUL0_9DIPT|nr:CLUMA_CG016794, isoform A [Clunio marinus]
MSERMTVKICFEDSESPSALNEHFFFSLNVAEMNSVYDDITFKKISQGRQTFPCSSSRCAVAETTKSLSTSACHCNPSHESFSNNRIAKADQKIFFVIMAPTKLIFASIKTRHSVHISVGLGRRAATTSTACRLQ